MAKPITKREDMIDDIRIARALLSEAQQAADPTNRDTLIAVHLEKIRQAQDAITRINADSMSKAARIAQLEKDVRTRELALAEHVNAPRISEFEKLVKQLAKYNM